MSDLHSKIDRLKDAVAQGQPDNRFNALLDVLREIERCLTAPGSGVRASGTSAGSAPQTF
jgi:hypothetical protein